MDQKIWVGGQRTEECLLQWQSPRQRDSDWPLGGHAPGFLHANQPVRILHTDFQDAYGVTLGQNGSSLYKMFKLGICLICVSKTLYLVDERVTVGKCCEVQR